MSEESEQPKENAEIASETRTSRAVGYCKPPIEAQFKMGNKASKGRPPSAGLSVKEFINELMAIEELTEAMVRKEARDKKNHPRKRLAAELIIRGMEYGDLADFAGLLSGENKLEDLHAMGINTEVVKKIKQKIRKVPIGEGKVEEIIDREIELHDRAGAAFDRIMDRTDGAPKQSVAIEGAGEAVQRLVSRLAGTSTPTNG